MPPLPDSNDAFEIRCIVTTFAKEEHATEVIRSLLREELIACGTLLRGARSIYVWKDNLEDTEEVVVIIKTTPEAAPAAAARLKELHPYENPQILLHHVESLNSDYTAWVRENVP